MVFFSRAAILARFARVHIPSLSHVANAPSTVSKIRDLIISICLKSRSKCWPYFRFSSKFSSPLAAC